MERIVEDHIKNREDAIIYVAQTIIVGASILLVMACAWITIALILGL